MKGLNLFEQAADLKTKAKKGDKVIRINFVSITGKPYYEEMICTEKSVHEHVVENNLPYNAIDGELIFTKDFIFLYIDKQSLQDAAIKENKSASSIVDIMKNNNYATFEESAKKMFRFWVVPPTFKNRFGSIYEKDGELWSIRRW